MARANIYNYVAGPSTLGIGVDNLALVQPPFPIDQPIYGPRYNVHKSFAPCDGAAQFPLKAWGPDIGLRADGVYMSGYLALQQLTASNNQGS